MEFLFALLLVVWVLSRFLGQSSSEPTSERRSESSERHVPDSRAKTEQSPSVQDAIREIEEQLSGKHSSAPSGETSRDSSQHWERQRNRASESDRSLPTQASSERSDRFPAAASAPEDIRTETGSTRRSGITGATSPDETLTFENDISRPSSLERTSAPTSGSSANLRRRIEKRLDSRHGRREAFLLKELLDSPRSQRPWPK